MTEFVIAYVGLALLFGGGLLLPLVDTLRDENRRERGQR